MSEPTSTPIRVGTRRSLLATTQAAGTPLVEAGNVGVFVTALRDALLRGDVDVAVHSLKDLPTTPDPRIALAAVPPREDPRDVVVARDGLTLGELPAGSRVGTGSPRRAAQLHALGMGLEVVDIRGNVDTRVGKVRSGAYDAGVDVAADVHDLQAHAQRVQLGGPAR